MHIIKHFFTLRNVFFLLLLLLVNGIFSYLVLFKGSDIHRENNLLENLQAGTLFLACVIFAAAATGLKDRHRWMAAFFSILCFIFFFRELDIEKFDVPQGIIFLLADNRGRSVFFIAAFAVLGVLVKHHRYFTAHRRTYLTSDMFIYTALSAVLLLVFSQMFDRKWVHVEQYILYEELSEFSAYYFLLVTAVISLREFKKIDMRIQGPANRQA